MTLSAGATPQSVVPAGAGPADGPEDRSELDGADTAATATAAEVTAVPEEASEPVPTGAVELATAGAYRLSPTAMPTALVVLVAVGLLSATSGAAGLPVRGC